MRERFRCLSQLHCFLLKLNHIYNFWSSSRAHVFVSERRGADVREDVEEAADELVVAREDCVGREKLWR